MNGSLNVGSPSQRPGGLADQLRNSFSSNPWATNSGPLNPDLESLLQTFSPKTSQPGAGNPFSPALLSGDLGGGGPGSHGGGGLFSNGTAEDGTAALMDSLFGNGSQPHTPRSSINSTAAAQALLEAAAAVGSPQRNSPLASLASKDPKMLGGLGNAGPRLLGDRHRATPSKLRIGSTPSDVGASAAAAAVAAAAALDMPGSPGQGQNMGDLSSLPPGFAAAAANMQQQQEAVAQAQAAAAFDASAAAAAAGLFGGGPSGGTPQQLQAMYMAMSAGMYPPYGYGQQPFPGGFPPNGGFSGMGMPGMPPPMGFPGYGPGFPGGFPPGMDPMGGAGMRPGMPMPGMPFAPGMPFPPVNPAEYAAYYQRYMEAQAQAMAAAMAGGGSASGHSVDSQESGGPMQHRQDRERDSRDHRDRDMPRGSGGPHPHDRPRGPAQNRAMGEHRDRRDSGADNRDGNRRRHSRRDDRPGDALLEEFKTNKARKFEFKDVLGHMHEFSLDQHGSRFIQQKLEVVPLEELDAAFHEVLPRVTVLMTDVFGNYVVQKFLEHGTPEHRTKIAETLQGQVLLLSLQMYGCRVVQKAIEVLDTDAQCELLAELDGNVMRCVRDQNGNHVIQKVIECVPTERITALIDNFLTCVVPLSSHPFGCRIIQRILEHCTDDGRKNVVMDEILRASAQLAQDQYGNYVIQHVLERGTPAERAQIAKALVPQVVAMSMHKFASNVVEKCLAYCGPAERNLLINAILSATGAPGKDGAAAAAGAEAGGEEGSGAEGGAHREGGAAAASEDPVQAMMKDQFGNYVVQKVLEVCDDAQRDVLMARVRAQLHNLKRFTYGKHIVARVEKLLSAGTKIQSHLRARPLPDDTQPLASIAPSSRPGSNGPSRTGSFTSRDGAAGMLRPPVPHASPLGAGSSGCVAAGPGSNSGAVVPPPPPPPPAAMPTATAVTNIEEALPSSF